MKLPKPTQHSGSMAGHIRKGRIYTPPLAASGVLHVENWVKEDLPDFLWPAIILSKYGDSGARRFICWQKAVQKRLLAKNEEEISWIADRLDGRFSHLAELVEKIPEASKVILEEAKCCHLLPENLCKALAIYPNFPTPWLIGKIVDEDPESRLVLELVHKALSYAMDRHGEALIKCLYIWSRLQAGVFSADKDIIDLLRGYPQELDKLSKADAVIRASWGAYKGMLLIKGPNHFAKAKKWSQDFWKFNFTIAKCIRKQDWDLKNQEYKDCYDDSKKNDYSAENAAPHIFEESDGCLRQFVTDLLSGFIETVELSNLTNITNEQREVVSGLISRAGRDLIAVLEAPSLWCVEHGAHIGRMLVEVKIYLAWMAQQDATIYRDFQEYGRGKAKLNSQILAEFPDEAKEGEFDADVEEFNRLSYNGGSIDLRAVDTRDTFANGKSVRKMAEEVGLLDFYRQTYTIFSGVTHSEWWSVEEYAMEPCINPLHGGHLVPSLSLNSGRNVDLVKSWIDQYCSLILMGLESLGVGVDESSFLTGMISSWFDEKEESPIVE